MYMCADVRDRYLQIFAGFALSNSKLFVQVRVLFFFWWWLRMIPSPTVLSFEWSEEPVNYTLSR